MYHVWAEGTFTMNVAVADSDVNLVAFQRMAGAMLASLQIAEHKARAAVTFRRPTKVFEDGVELMRLNYLLGFDGIIASRGGIPLIDRGSIIGDRLSGRYGFPGRGRERGGGGSNQQTPGGDQVIHVTRGAESAVARKTSE